METMTIAANAQGNFVAVSIACVSLHRWNPLAPFDGGFPIAALRKRKKKKKNTVREMNGFQLSDAEFLFSKTNRAWFSERT